MNIRLGLVSSYSLLYGVRRHSELLDRASSFGVKAVSVCDLNNLYGVHTFLETAKEKGIRPIIGCALKGGGEHGGGEAGSVGGSHPTVYCFVENRAGFSRVCEILTARNRDKEKFDPLPLLRENAAGLVLASANGEVLRSLAGQVKRLYAAITPDDLGGLGPHRALSLPLAFLDNSAFLDRTDLAVHRVLRAIGLNKTIGTLEPADTSAGTLAEGSGIMKTSPELWKRLKSWPQAIKGSAEIAESACYNELFDGFIFPSYGEAPGDELRRRTYDGASLRYGALGDGEIERIEYELNIIEKMGFSPYFLRMDDIVRMACVNGVRRTCGRGSGAASIVSYSLGITNVDPIAHNLYFERFLNPSRPDPPDIDVDFAWDERDDLIKAVIDGFGPEYCARVANHNFFRPRSALRETAKAYGFSDGAISQLERKLEMGEGKSGMGEDPLWQEIFTIAKRIEGLPRGLGMHCGGLVITPEPISRYVPVEKSAEGYPLLAWEKEGTEAAGFVKIDLLGNRSLAVIRDAVKNIAERGGWDEELDRQLSRAADNRETIEALSRGDSMGVFYIESPAMRQLQKKTGAGDFEHIVIHSSLIRPAANKFISEYVRRLKGGEWEPLHPRLEKILDETYGILCYQEDVSKTAVAMAGFNEADADKLRKVIAKKMGGAKMALYEKQFFEGCRKNNVSDETIKKIWDMMLSFDGYSFCKPHSASYAMVSFQSAFLRVHYPAEFMAAVLSNQGGYYRPGAYISESRRMGLSIEGPDINVSRWKYYGGTKEKREIRKEKREEGKEKLEKRKEEREEGKEKRGRIIIGLMAIRGVSGVGAGEIVKERDRGGEYKSLDDFSRRVKLGRDDIIALCPAGVFDSISCGVSRAMQARKLLSMIKEKREIRKEKREMKNGELFSEEAMAANENGIIPHFPIPVSNSNSNSDSASLWEEYRALGFLRRLHSLALWKEQILPLKRIKARSIQDYTGRNVRMLGWPITQKEVWTKDGLTMSFLSLEDETGMYETVIFPKIYERYNKLLFDQRPLVVYGKVMSDEGAITLEVTKIEALGKKTAGDFLTLRCLSPSLIGQILF